MKCLIIISEESLTVCGGQEWLTTKFQKKATNTYRSKFDIIQIRVPQGSREQISKHASSCGESINAFINRAITETITRDTQKNQPESFIKTKESQED